MGGAVRDSGCTRVTACVFHVLLENSGSALPGYVQYEFFNIGILFVLNFLFLNTVTFFVGWRETVKVAISHITSHLYWDVGVYLMAGDECEFTVLELCGSGSCVRMALIACSEHCQLHFV